MKEISDGQGKDERKYLQQISLMIFPKLTGIKWLLSSQALKQDEGIYFTMPY